MKKSIEKIGFLCFFLLFISLYSYLRAPRQYLSSFDKKDIFPTIDKYNITRPDLHHFFYSKDIWERTNVTYNRDIATDTTFVLLNTKIDTLYVKRKQPIINIDVYVTNNSDSTITFLHDPESAYGYLSSGFYPVVYNTWKNEGKKTYKCPRKIDEDFLSGMKGNQFGEGDIEQSMQNFQSNISIIKAKETVKMKVKFDIRFLNGSQLFIKLTKNEYYVSILYKCSPGYYERLSEIFEMDIDVKNLYGGRTRSNLMKLIVED
jgi:hypothetical protein